MFTKAVSVVASKGYRMEVEFMPEWISVEIKDGGHRITRFTESPDTKLYEIGETILAQVCVYEYDLAQALEADDPVECKPSWSYYWIDLHDKHNEPGTRLHIIAKVENSDGRIMEAKFSSGVHNSVCEGCGHKHFIVPCERFRGTQEQFDSGRWHKLPALVLDESYDLLRINLCSPSLFKKAVTPCP